MKQVARNLTDPFDGFLAGKHFLLMDRDGKFCESFRNLVEDAGVTPHRLPPRSPDLSVVAASPFAPSDLQYLLEQQERQRAARSRSVVTWKHAKGWP